jgi:hypothetical protein
MGVAMIATLEMAEVVMRASRGVIVPAQELILRRETEISADLFRQG